MKAVSIRILSTALICALASACSQGAQATPTATSSPSATFTSAPTGTATITETATLAITETPTSTPEGPIGEFILEQDAALYYERAIWDNTLRHHSLEGCMMFNAGGTEFHYDTVPSSPIVLSGFNWIVYYPQNSFDEYQVSIPNHNNQYGNGVGRPVFVGAVRLELGSAPTECRAAVESVLKTLHYPDYFQKGECHLAVAKQISTGVKANLLIDTNLRREPRWGDEFILRLIGSADGVVDVIGGPMCGLTPYGEYYYWQIKLASGETGWVAEGDASQYFIEETK